MAIFLLHPDRGVGYWNQFVCLSASIALGPVDWSSRNLLCRSPVAVARSASGVVTYTSGFMDDVAFGHNRPYGDAWLEALRYRGGVWCLWMPCYWGCCSWYPHFVASSALPLPTLMYWPIKRLQCCMLSGCWSSAVRGNCRLWSWTNVQPDIVLIVLKCFKFCPAEWMPVPVNHKWLQVQAVLTFNSH